MPNNNDDYGDEQPTDEYPNARATLAFPEPYAYGFRRTIAQNAAAAERAEGKLLLILFTPISELTSTAVRRAAATPSSPTPDVAPSGFGPHLLTFSPHSYDSSPPQAQPTGSQGFTNHNEHHTKYLRSHQADIYYVAPLQHLQARGSQGYGNADPRVPQPGGYGHGNPPPAPYVNPVLTYAGPSSSTSRPVPSPSIPAAATSTSPKRGRGRKIDVQLDRGFAWDQESLALLCHWKDRMKKGSVAAVDSGEFPGKTPENLDNVWMSRRQEAREAYEALAKE